jgi:two-component system response regulator YesN
MYSMIIADDDVATCERIRNFLIKNFEELDNIWIATNGLEAFSLYEQHHPNIVLTDIAMPLCDGLELTEKLHQSGYTPKIVIISAHRNFNYAQNALRLGVEDYLSKPILPAKLKELISKLIDSLSKNKQFLLNINNLMDKHQKNLPVLRERFFYSLINECFEEERIMERARMVDIDLNGAAYTTAVIRVEAGAVINTKHNFVDILSDYIAEVSDILFPNDIKIFNIVINSTDIVLIAVYSDSNLTAFFRIMNTVLSKMVQSIGKYSFSIYAALGKQYHSVIGIRDSYKEAMKALNCGQQANHIGKIINYEETLPSQKIEFKVNNALETNLLQSVKYKNYDQYVKLIDQLVDKMMPYRSTKFNHIKTYLLELSVIIFWELQKCTDLNTGFEVNFNSLLQSEAFEQSIDWFKDYISRVIEIYKNQNEEKGNALVNKGKHIIQSNLHNPDFSIDDVASELYISSNYFRQIFKQQTNESFVEYLTRMRMQKAISLLINSEAKIQDIAELTGFSNQRYFSVCFKNHYGYTPSEVRKNFLNDLDLPNIDDKQIIK